MGFSERFPRWITALIGIAQLVITAVIVGLEIVSAYIDLGHGTIWVGLWCGIIFLATFLGMLFITCCCRGRYCSFYVFIFTVISGLLACVIIYFDQIFMNDPCKCYLGNEVCCIARSIPALQSNYSNILTECASATIDGTIASKVCTRIPYDKLVYIKIQLGFACAMVVVSGIFVVVFLFACFGVCFGHD